MGRVTSFFFKSGFRDTRWTCSTARARCTTVHGHGTRSGLRRESVCLLDNEHKNVLECPCSTEKKKVCVSGKRCQKCVGFFSVFVCVHACAFCVCIACLSAVGMSLFGQI